MGVISLFLSGEEGQEGPLKGQPEHAPLQGTPEHAPLQGTPEHANEEALKVQTEHANEDANLSDVYVTCIFVFPTFALGLYSSLITTVTCR